MTNATKWAINAATLMKVPFAQELPMYQQGGFTHVELWLDKISAYLAAGNTVEQTRQLLDDNRITPVGACSGVVRLDADETTWAAQQADLVKRLDLCHDLDIPTLVTVVVGERSERCETDMAVIVRRARWLSTQAGDRNVNIGLEFLARIPAIETLSTAIRVIREVDSSYFGLVIDLYHYHLSPSRLSDLDALPSDKLFLVHIDDALAKPIEYLSHDDRTFPGEGVLDISGLMRDICQRTGYDGYWSVELHSEWIWDLEPTEVIRRLTAGLEKL